MRKQTQKDRTLAYKTANLITNEDLLKISGGANPGCNTTRYTTKQTFDTHGNWDVGADIEWD
ncbi:TPA: hypothetical protein RG395_002385 [Legionella pneumophila]|nr:hypothetical protein [Legionella pneumophila]MDW8878728.1 hypothetical protein [Legionella pneumophila subsp. fraseri]MDW8962958.1 hypothetical protein [Legionella pneumophila subsp. fraseri]MDW9035452.1 hypothetical protein [Legionella pneumophila subsp. fraseri]MDW9038513.1 hypothetical protein [Legionella pneumophila subsp. fraseri]MDW9041574.1 hypothetical protein [Legionella pneumophila subsp. fraseri]